MQGKYLLPLIFAGCFTIYLYYKDNVEESGQVGIADEETDITEVEDINAQEDVDVAQEEDEIEEEDADIAGAQDSIEDEEAMGIVYTSDHHVASHAIAHIVNESVIQIGAQNITHLHF